MTITDFSGPIVVFQDGGILPNSSANQNPDQAPSLFLQATGLLDPRQPYTFFPGMPDAPLSFGSGGAAVNPVPALGWLNASFQVADYAPGTASTTSLFSGTMSSTSIALITASAGNITVNSSCVNPLTGATVTGLWLIDNKPNYISFGQGAIGIWDPANPAIGRAISILSTTSQTTTTFTISGYDAYGYPITQVMNGGAANTTVSSTKTFKWVASITSSGTSTSTVSFGVTDTYGLPMYASALAYLDMYWYNTAIPTNTTVTATFVAGSSTTTTGSSDVRGTINPSNITASNGTVKMQLWMSVAPANISTTTGIFGVTPA